MRRRPFSLDQTRWFDYMKLMTYGQLGRHEDAKAMLDLIFFRNTIRQPETGIGPAKPTISAKKTWRTCSTGCARADFPSMHSVSRDARRTAWIQQNWKKLAEGKHVARCGTVTGWSFVQTGVRGRPASHFTTRRHCRSETAWVEDGMFCVSFSSKRAGAGTTCGYVYRNPGGTPAGNDEYVRARDR